VVHPGAGNPDRTLVNALLAHCGAGLSGIGGEVRPGIVYRLDKDTSGLLVVAKTDAAHAALSAQLARRTMKRTYLAVVHGTPRPAEGTIDRPIGRSPHDRKRMAVVATGRPAVTRYRVLRPLGPEASLVECRLETGRTHQIRVHMAAIGHPVVGDPVYGRTRKTDNPAMRGFPRQALHAVRLELDDPETGRRLGFDSPLPGDIRSLIASLESFKNHYI
jgi:23S rRNA pseudouridine1911/1915/1917 synthase